MSPSEVEVEVEVDVDVDVVDVSTSTVTLEKDGVCKVSSTTLSFTPCSTNAGAKTSLKLSGSELIVSMSSTTSAACSAGTITV